MIHVEDLELILNGLGYSPTNVQLEEMAFEIRFRDSHVTWEVHESIYIDDFCQIIENYGKWLNLSKIEEVEKEETKSISEFIEKSVDTFKCFTSFLTGVEEFEDKSEEFQTENQTEDQIEDQTENQTEDITEDQTEDQTEDKTEGHSEAYQSEEGQESEEDYE